MLNDSNRVHPHIAADTWELLGPFLTEETEEFTECLLGSSLTAPDQSLCLKIIVIGQIPVSSSPGDLIYVPMGDPGDAPILEARDEDKIDGSGYCSPRTPVEPCYLELGEQSSPH